MNTQHAASGVFAPDPARPVAAEYFVTFFDYPQRTFHSVVFLIGEYPRHAARFKTPRAMNRLQNVFEAAIRG